MTAVAVREKYQRLGDRVYTPDWCAKDMIAHFQPSGVILEPCRGKGAFFNLLPTGSHWCEIDEGRDFFDWTELVDWIITNPPFSLLRPFMVHSFELAQNVVLLAPARNVVSGYGIVREAFKFGFGVPREIRWYGGGARLGFPMGNAVAAFYWQQGYKRKNTEQTFYEDDQ